MTGTNAAAIVTPIVAFILLALWLSMVFYADSHPRYPSSPASREQRATVAGEQQEIPPGERPQEGEVPRMPRPRSSLDEPSGAGATSARRPESGA